MVTPELLEYVRQQKSQGMTDELIIKNLSTVHWNPEDVREAVSNIDKPSIAHVGSIESEKYRNYSTWSIFCFWTVLLIIRECISAYTFGFKEVGINYLYLYIIPEVVPYIIALYIGAYISTIGLKSRGEKWKDILEFIVRGIGAAVIAWPANIFTGTLYLMTEGIFTGRPL